MSNEIVFESLKNSHYMMLSIYGMPRYLEKISDNKYLIKGKSFLSNEQLFDDFDPSIEVTDQPEKGFKSIEFDGGPKIEIGSILLLPSRHLSVEEIKSALPSEINNKEIELGQILKYKLTVKLKKHTHK